MPIGSSEEIPSDTVVHRVGGGGAANLRLSPLDAQQTPLGISVLLHGRQDLVLSLIRPHVFQIMRASFIRRV